MQKIVLVVDDDPAIQELLQAILESDGYQVEIADDGIMALEKMTSNRPVLIILDYMLPNMDGRMFLDELKKRDDINIPIIMISAHNVPSDDIHRVEAYIAKPFNMFDLLNEVAKWRIKQDL